MPSIKYTAVKPEVPTPPANAMRTEYLFGNVRDEFGEVEGGTTRVRTRRRDVPPAEPTAITDEGERFWPIFLRDREPVHPAIAAHDLANGAELLTSEDECLAIIEQVRQEAGGMVDHDAYVRVVIAAARGARANSARRLEALLARQPDLDVDADLPEGAVRREASDGFLVSQKDVAEVLGKSEHWVRRAVARGELPAPAKKIGYTTYYRSTALARCFAA